MTSEIETSTAPLKTFGKFKPRYTSEYSDDAWIVKVTLPGVSRDDLDILTENEILSVTGLRRANVPESWRRISGSDAECRYELRLDVGPEVDDSQIEAMLENGELTIRLPLKEEAKPKTIPVT